ncbi:hypothetical protein HD554DRAFT_2142956, partial [Boletus coccyginus]
PKDTVVALLAKIPAVSARREDLRELYGRLKILLHRSPRASMLFTSCFLINLGSLPFVWHSLSPVGANPFEFSVTHKRWASIDDIDLFGLHLSNSSYAKALDSGRTTAFIKYFPNWFHNEGQVALGATHYHFIREIAPLASYEVRVTIASWDHKWLYVVARYVTRPSRRHATNRSPQSSAPPTPNGAPAQNGSADVEHAIAAIINPGVNGTGNTHRAPIAEPDGAILHCVAVSQTCFKRGRITVPPAIVLASEGFTKPYSDSDAGSVDGSGVGSYSRANPPPNWIKSQLLRIPPQGSMDKFRAFSRDNWREVPEGERWWEDALGGSIEAKRQANLEILESLRMGLERVRTLHEKQ